MAAPKTSKATPNPASRSPIDIEQTDCTPFFQGYSWTIKDQSLLVCYLARLVLGQSLAVARVLHALDTDLPGSPAETAIEAAIKELRSPGTDKNRRWRRDGWIFQMIAWLAAWNRGTSQDRIRAPQIRQGEHGIDGLLIQLVDGGPGVRGVTICEQKATENPRQKIQQQVWPDLVDYESGARDNQLVSEVTALLEKEDAATATELAAKIHWESQRWYRVAVTVDENQDGESLKKLFAGYDNAVMGTDERRHGEVLHIQDLRGWMDQICQLITAELKTLKARK